MKTIILKNNVMDMQTVLSGTALVTEKLKTIGVDMIFEFHDTNKQFSSIGNVYTDQANNTITSYVIPVDEIMSSATFGDADIYCLIYDWSKLNPRTTNPATVGKYMQIPWQWYTDTEKNPPVGLPEVFCQFFLHELCHSQYKNFSEDKTHLQAYNPEWSQKQPTDYYLFLLKSLIKPMTTTKPKYKYFKDSEIVNLNPNLVKILDQAREIAGVPFIISNGFRTPAQNAAIPGSAKNSPHMRGLAADLRCRDSITRSKMLWGLMQFRDVLFIEVAGGHLHVDIDAGVHPMGSVMWGDDSN